MNKTLINTVPLAALTAENIGQRSGDTYGEARLKEYKERRRKYLGRVLEVIDTDRYESRGWDDGDNVLKRTVIVWDPAQGKSVEFVTDSHVGYYDQRSKMASAWEVEATPETVTAYRKWVVTKEAPRLAEYRAKEARDKYTAELNAERNAVESGSFKRGDLYEVVAGRKYPHGLRGKVFWIGSNKFGQSVGLSTSDRKLPNGRNADVIFINPKNLKKVLTEEDVKRVGEIKAELAKADEVEQEAYRENLLKQYEGYAATWGVAVAAVVRRTEEVLTKEVADLDARATYISTDSWACDGPASRQVEDECRSLDTKIKNYKRVLKALAPTATAVAA